jgi:predicted ATPase/DNA-binding CsgD family transcriptional regulator
MVSYQAQTWIEPLNPREIEILNLISEGLSNREISKQLHLSPETVKWYNKQMYSKLGVNSRSQAVNIAKQNDLLNEGRPPSEEVEQVRSNLPAQLTSFIGRADEVAEVKTLLKSSRLVVLTGPGGTGKTRLALQVSGELIPAFRDGVWLVQLASLRDPALVPNSISQALNLNPLGDSSLVDFLKHYLRRKHLLLVMDNFEHLLEAAPLLGELLAAAPQLTVLATSRERLRVYGEQEYPVRPLRLPDHERRESPEKLLGYEAVDLFIQRARYAQPRLEISEKHLPAVARICLRLDGLPLALELAASQVKIYPLPVLADRLDESLGALPEGPRDLPERQRTLRGTIAWSENLLNPDEKILFARLSIFGGGGSLEAVEAVCGHGLNLKTFQMLSSLVDKNLVLAREDQEGELRFSMLETIRGYARERLTLIDETWEMNRRHAAYFADMAERAGKEFRTIRQAYWFPRLRAEQDNLRAALDWSLSGEALDYGMRMAASLGDHWYYNGFAVEGRRWTDLAIEKADQASPALLAGVLRTAGNLTYNLNDLSRGKDLLQRAIDLYQQVGDEDGAAWAATFLGAMGVHSEGEIHIYTQYLMQSLETFRKIGDQPGIAQALNILGELARVSGDYSSARTYYEECLEIVKQTGEVIREAIQYENLGLIAYHEDQHQLAEKLIRQAVSKFRDLNTNYGMATSLTTLAGPAAKLGYPRRGARLLGAADAEMESLGISQQPADQIEVKMFLLDVHLALGPDEFQKAWEEGQAMSIQEAVEYALSQYGEDEAGGRH